MSTILVLVTTADGAADELSLQALALGRQLAGGGAVHALVTNDAGAAPSLGAWGATHVHVAEHPAFGTFAPDAVGRTLADLAGLLGADAVIGPGSENGNTIVARSAARAAEPFAANVIGLTLAMPSRVVRQRWGGSLQEEAALHASRVFVSVAPHAVQAAEVDGTAEVSSFTPELEEADLAVRVVGRVPAAAGGVSLADAKVVVSGGRGVGSAEGFKPVEELAAMLGAAVGCSRAVTIAGWRSHTAQVGQTGTKIAPNLYIAAGISGATQHMAGAKGAKKLLAINKDAEAPIMSAADYVVIGDLHQVLPAISAEIRRVKGA